MVLFKKCPQREKGKGNGVLLKDMPIPVDNKVLVANPQRLRPSQALELSARKMKCCNSWFLGRNLIIKFDCILRIFYIYINLI